MMWKQPMLRIVVAGLICCLLASTLHAQPEKKRRKKKQRGGPVAGRLVAQLKKADLTEEQQKQLQELVAKYGKQIKELQATAKLSGDQRKARAKAVKEANEKGLKGKQRREFVAEAMGMTDAQKEAMEKLAKLQAELRKEAMSILTPQQKQKLRQSRGRKKKSDR